MKRQRGMVLLISLVLSLLLGLLATSALSDGLLQTRLASQLLANARALEQAEAALLEGAARLVVASPPACQPCMPQRMRSTYKAARAAGKLATAAFSLCRIWARAPAPRTCRQACR
jgi:Tfp pilus assembly protein PilX